MRVLVGCKRVIDYAVKVSYYVISMCYLNVLLSEQQSILCVSEDEVLCSQDCEIYVRSRIDLLIFTGMVTHLGHRR